jgi:hypothetical protein
MITTLMAREPTIPTKLQPIKVLRATETQFVLEVRHMMMRMKIIHMTKIVIIATMKSIAMGIQRTRTVMGVIDINDQFI